MRIDKTLERYILSIYGEEPFPYEWTEQDLCEQIRGLVSLHNRGGLDIPPVPSKYERLKKRHHELQGDFLDLVALYYERCGELPGQLGGLAPIAGADVEEVQ
jgi:hypothetical protein